MCRSHSIRFTGAQGGWGGGRRGCVPCLPHPTSPTQAPSYQFTSVFFVKLAQSLHLHPVEFVRWFPVWCGVCLSCSGAAPACVVQVGCGIPCVSSTCWCAIDRRGCPIPCVARWVPASLCNARCTPYGLPPSAAPPGTVPMNTWIDSGPFVSTHVGEGRGCTPCAVVAVSPEQLVFVLVALLFPSPLNQALMRPLHPSQSQHLQAVHPPR